MRVVVAGGDFQRGLADRRCAGLRQQAEGGVDVGRGRLDQTQRADETARHRYAGNGEVLHGALGLRAPERIGGDAQFAHAVVFGAEARLAGHLSVLSVRPERRPQARSRRIRHASFDSGARRQRSGRTGSGAIEHTPGAIDGRPCQEPALGRDPDLTV